jgi:hypothetical protein
MKTKQKIISELKLEYPTLRVGNDDDGYVNLSAEEYEATISQWADAELEKLIKEAEAQAKAEAKEAAQAKLAALGLTVEDLTALGL